MDNYENEGIHSDESCPKCFKNGNVNPYNVRHEGEWCTFYANCHDCKLKWHFTTRQGFLFWND